ncbi:MAG: MarR family transcriptional regulator [Rhodobacterales bacterium]|nr:MarR family transcriptional regulator [Rhodobacterales bacterium]
MNRLGFVARRQLAAAFEARGHKISAEEWAVLLILWNKDAVMPSVLADRTIRDRTTMTRMIDTMVRKGMVRREVDAADRRKSLIMLTDQGRALQGPLGGIAKTMIDASLAGIAAQDMEITLRVLRAMTENLLQEE